MYKLPPEGGTTNPIIGEKMLRTNIILNLVRLRPCRLIPLLVIALSIGSLLVLPQNSSAASYTQELEKLNRLVQSSGGSDVELKIFREGRDSIGDEAWDQAAAKFREYINKYPRGKDTDAALYWLARSEERRVGKECG